MAHHHLGELRTIYLLYYSGAQHASVAMTHASHEFTDVALVNAPDQIDSFHLPKPLHLTLFELPFVYEGLLLPQGVSQRHVKPAITMVHAFGKFTPVMLFVSWDVVLVKTAEAIVLVVSKTAMVGADILEIEFIASYL